MSPESRKTFGISGVAAVSRAEPALCARLVGRTGVQRLLVTTDALVSPRWAASVQSWLRVLCALVVLMVVVGGITRLTGSGLSIVQWRPITGAVPPLSDAQWNDAFAQYQAFPQFKHLGSTMTLEEFKRIFFWEYIHRLLGRAIGLAVVVPWVVLQWKGALTRAMNRRLLAVLALGGAQGVMGWVMVKSGLVDVPRVSHYRLLAHLALALTLLASLFLLSLRVRPAEPARASRALIVSTRISLGLLCAQIAYGALTAGLHAGVGYNTFPTMHGAWFPIDGLSLTPLWRDFFDNPATVQFFHRALGTMLVCSLVSTYVVARRSHADGRLQRATLTTLAMAAAQFSLGVATLVLVVPISLAVVHQLGACVLLLLAVRSHHLARTA